MFFTLLKEMTDGFEQAMNIVKASEGKLWKVMKSTVKKRLRRYKNLGFRVEF